MEKQFLLSNLYEEIEGKNIIIYGTGYVGMRLYQSLSVKSDCNIIGFCESDPHNKFVKEIGLPLYSLENIKKINNHIVLVAVHDVYFKEIKDNLERYGINNYRYVYPLMINFSCGDPIDIKSVNTIDVISRIVDYNIPIKVLAIEEHDGKNTVGFNMYLKLLSTYNSIETAKNRLYSCINNIEKIDKEGFDYNRYISLDENYNVLDGAHRLAYAFERKVNRLNALIYPALESYEKYAGNTFVGSEKKLKELGFTSKEIQHISEKYTALKLL